MIRYLDLAELLLIAEGVTGIDAVTLSKLPNLSLADSALHAPEASFSDVEFYPELVDKAAVLALHLCKNHAFPDGNKRTAWAAMRVFLLLNGVDITVDEATAVKYMVAIAAGTMEVAEFSAMLHLMLNR